MGVSRGRFWRQKHVRLLLPKNSPLLQGKFGQLHSFGGEIDRHILHWNGLPRFQRSQSLQDWRQKQLPCRLQNIRPAEQSGLDDTIQHFQQEDREFPTKTTPYRGCDSGKKWLRRLYQIRDEVFGFSAIIQLAHRRRRSMVVARHQIQRAEWRLPRELLLARVRDKSQQHSL